MGNVLALTSREWKSYWYSPVAYVVGTCFLLLHGWGFWFLMNVLNDPRVDPNLTVSQLFFGTFWYWFSILVMAPLLTMRVFSEEKRTGTIEVLLSAPVTDAQVVVSKFLGAWLSYCTLWAITVVYFVIFTRFGSLDWGQALTGYLGTALMGGMFIAIGVFASSTTRNQVVAGFMTFVLILLLFLVGMLGVFIKDPETTKLLQYLSVLEHLRDYSKGIIDSRPILLNVTVVLVFLFLAARTIGNPRWRA